MVTRAVLIFAAVAWLAVGLVMSAGPAGADQIGQEKSLCYQVMSSFDASPETYQVACLFRAPPGPQRAVRTMTWHKNCSAVSQRDSVTTRFQIEQRNELILDVRIPTTCQPSSVVGIVNPRTDEPIRCPDGTMLSASDDPPTLPDPPVDESQIEPMPICPDGSTPLEYQRMLGANRIPG